jgi:hypothetical protein
MDASANKTAENAGKVLHGVKQQQGGGGGKARRGAYLPRYFVEFLLREAAEKALVVAFVRDDVGQVRGEVSRIPGGKSQ